MNVQRVRRSLPGRDRHGLVLAAWGMAAALVAGLVVLAPVSAPADTAPPPGDPNNPRTVGVNPLPTVQIGPGVVWSQVIVGNTVYAAGEFSTARPAGAAPGTQQVTRNNLLAFDINSGVLVNGWAPSTNGPVYDITASPDGSRIYIGGNFTQVNGVTRNRVGALNPSTGALISSFNPNVSGSTYGISATNTTVYYGGSFGSAGGQARTRLAANRASDGALLPWAPKAEGGLVRDVLVSPDATQVLVGGSFTTLNGSSNPGYGLGAVDAVTGALKPWAANTALVRNGGPNGDILSLTGDGAGSVYATGGTYSRSGGTLEGAARMSWDGGKVVWIEDCHGDSYDALPLDGVVYVVTHAHYCGNVPGGFPQSEPWTKNKGIAFTEHVTGVLRQEYLGYSNFAGTPAPSLLHWYPDMQYGNYTASGQAAWNLVGNSDYVVAGGEFPRVGGVAQQGLVRFARPDLPGTPNSSGPQVQGSETNPTVTSPGAGQALVCWQTNYDRDNEFLTYRVIRNNVVSAPIATRTVGSAEWTRPYQCFLDSGQTPGASVSYRIFTTDPFGNSTQSGPVAVTISGTGSAGAYGAAVAADGPMHYWRLDEASGSTAADSTGLRWMTTTAGVTKGVPGAIAGHTAYTFNGSSNQIAYTSLSRPGPFYYSVEAWFRTSSSQGGKIVGFGNSQTGSSGTHDRMLYLDGSGRVNFGSRQGGGHRVLSSGTGFNNNQWHHAVGTVDDAGMSLYVDGTRVGFRADTRTGFSYNGYWRVGGDYISSSWANNPPNDYFSGSIDEVAVYTRALTAGQVSQHYAARSGQTVNQPPVAAFTFTTSGLTAQFDSSGSSDSDGTIVSRAWAFGDGGTSTQANPAHSYAAPGTYTVTLTVTDDDGATNQASRLVTVDDGGTVTPVVSDTFTRTLAGSWGQADVGGSWTIQSPTSRYAVGSGAGRMTLDAPGAGPWASLTDVSAADLNGSVDVSTDKAATGGGIYHTVALRRVGASEYRVKIWLPSNGSVVLVISRLVSGSQTTLGTYTVPGLTYTPGDRIRLEYAIAGSGTTTITAKAWLVGTTEPGVQLSRTDSTAGSLQGPGSVAVQGYLAGSATNAPVVATFDNLSMFAG